jgi:SAM-dependent methyltransferase
MHEPETEREHEHRPGRDEQDAGARQAEQERDLSRVAPAARGLEPDAGDGEARDEQEGTEQVEEERPVAGGGGDHAHTVPWARAAWDRRYAEREPDLVATPHVHLAEAAERLPPGRALDLACGAGRNAVWLAERGWAVTAVDFSPVAIASARALAARSGVGVAWTVADLLDFEPAPRAYDLVLVFFLHLPPAERDAVLRKAVAAVAPGGTFLLAAHDRRNLAEGHHGPRDPEVLYGAEDVVPLLDGLEVARAERVYRPIETPEGRAVMVDAVVRATRPRAGAAGG